MISSAGDWDVPSPPVRWWLSKMSVEIDKPVALCLFGAGGHGRVVASQIVRRFGTQVLFGDAALPQGSLVDGHAVRFASVGECSDVPLLVTVGDNAARRRLTEEALAAGIRFATVVVDGDRYFAAPCGAGTQVLAGAVVNCGAAIGRGVIVNSNAVVEHDAVVGDFCHLAPGSVIGGGVRLGDGVFLGTGAVVLPGVAVAAGAVIGAGATVTRPITDAGVYVGVPARRVVRGTQGGGR
jgi:UDP-perosamine 4-acetyltransferase